MPSHRLLESFFLCILAEKGTFTRPLGVDLEGGGSSSTPGALHSTLGFAWESGMGGCGSEREVSLILALVVVGVHSAWTLISESPICNSHGTVLLPFSMSLHDNTSRICPPFLDLLGFIKENPQRIFCSCQTHKILGKDSKNTKISKENPCLCLSKVIDKTNERIRFENERVTPVAVLARGWRLGGIWGAVMVLHHALLYSSHNKALSHHASPR